MRTKDYSEDWQDTIRPSILKRDHYKCRKCKVSHRAKGYYNLLKLFVECDYFMTLWCERNNIKVIRIILQVHHINGNKKDNSDKNLISLCPRCHFDQEKELNRLKRISKGIISKQ